MWEEFGHQTQEALVERGGMGRGEAGGVVSPRLENRLNSSLTCSFSETGLLLAGGTAPCTYLSMSVLRAKRSCMCVTTGRGGQPQALGVSKAPVLWDFKPQVFVALFASTFQAGTVLQSPEKCLLLELSQRNGAVVPPETRGRLHPIAGDNSVVSLREVPFGFLD